MDQLELTKLDDEMFDAYQSHDIELILSHCADDILMHDYGQEPVRGKEAARDFLTAQFGTFSDEKGSRYSRIVGDSEVFSEVAWTATNTGDLAMPDGTTIPATGKTVNTRLAYYARVNDTGEVAEIRGYPDIADMMGQLGLMPG